MRQIPLLDMPNWSNQGRRGNVRAPKFTATFSQLSKGVSNPSVHW